MASKLTRRAFLKGTAGAVVSLASVPVVGRVVEATGLADWGRTTLQDLVEETMKLRSAQIAENISNHNSLLNTLRENRPVRHGE